MQITNPDKSIIKQFGSNVPANFWSLFKDNHTGCIWFPYTKTGWGLVTVTWKSIKKKKIMTLKIDVSDM